MCELRNVSVVGWVWDSECCCIGVSVYVCVSVEMCVWVGERAGMSVSVRMLV